MYKMGSSSFPLNTYNLHFLRGFLASGGSLYFTTVPLTVLASSVKAPESPRFTPSFSFDADLDLDCDASELSELSD